MAVQGERLEVRMVKKTPDRAEPAGSSEGFGLYFKGNRKIGFTGHQTEIFHFEQPSVQTVNFVYFL